MGDEIGKRHAVNDHTDSVSTLCNNPYRSLFRKHRRVQDCWLAIDSTHSHSDA
jgi:hypothetical protein